VFATSSGTNSPGVRVENPLLNSDVATTGDRNTAIGRVALINNTSGSANVANGNGALFLNTVGTRNTAIGNSAFNSNTTGSNNIALGVNAGFNLTTGNSNIDIGNVGVARESKTIRIGKVGTQTKAFIAGISGATVRGTAVVVNSSGQLGVAASSQRFKQHIQTMGDASDMLLALRPVTFEYKPDVDPNCIRQFGLVAEEV
jgi:Chaperone of endosialidase